MADFKLGRLKFKWRGDWAVSTAYLIDDIVKYGGNTYVVIVNHTSAATIANFYTDLTAAKYSLHTEGLFFKGNWAGSTFYKLNDLVKNGAYQYRCILQHTSAGSFAIGSNWQVFTEGLQWEDSYSSGTTYSDGDVVTYGGYTYVYVNDTPSSGNTPTDNTYWDVVTTGFKATGDYSAGTAYKTGDTINFGGWSYVCKINTTAGQNPYTTPSSWTVINEGFNFLGTYSAGTTYFKGDVVVYTASSYVALDHNVLAITPGTNAAKWGLVAQGDSAATLTTRGDISYRDATQITRLPLGTSGSVLTSNGLEPVWKNPDAKNVLYVSNGGSDTNPGTQLLPFKTIKKALSIAGKGDIVDIDTISGGSGGTSGIYDVVGSGGSGSGFEARVVIDSSSTPVITITNGGTGYTVGNTITISSAQLGGTPATNLTFNVKSVSVGDVIDVSNGVYLEILPLKVPAGVTIKGQSLRGTEIRPAAGKSTTVATINNVAGGTGGSTGTYSYIHQTSSSSLGKGIVVNVIKHATNPISVSVYHGGYDYITGETITISSANLGGGTNLTFNVATLEDNNASYMFLTNDSNNITLMTMKGMTGTAVHNGAGAVIVSLDPEGSILTASPYVQDCSSINNNATGIKIDGFLHTTGNKSILANDFTQINSDGVGVFALGGGRGEMVSVFTYYCNKSFHALDGGFIRALNCSSAYGEEGAVANGTLAAETPIGVQGNGQVLEYNPLVFGGGATESDIANSITTNGSGTATVLGLTSGATATFFRYNVTLNYLHIKNRTGNFQKGEIIRITKENASQFTVTLSSTFGALDSSTVAQLGQVGPLISVKSGTTTLSSTGLIKVGSNIKFTGNSTFYRINAVTEENTSAGTATVRLTEYITSANALENNVVGSVTQKFSNVRLTGHDFLSIGTGGFTDTNYPNVPTQPADQADEVSELSGGRVYFSSTDQDGDFRVGDLFRIQQSTGIATLNADAFDLSGLSELQLGSIGAELGATINEFSTDETLGGDSNQAVPTERATKRYVDSGTATITNKNLNSGTNTFPTITVAGNSGSDAVSLGETLTVTGSGLVSTAITGNTVTISSTAASTGKAIAMAIVFGG